LGFRLKVWVNHSQIDCEIVFKWFPPVLNWIPLDKGSAIYSTSNFDISNLAETSLFRKTRKQIKPSCYPENNLEKWQKASGSQTQLDIGSIWIEKSPK
jgi:hypothetical protein